MINIITKCMNKECNNYKQELNEGTEICGLCNKQAVKFESKVNPRLKIAAIFAGIGSLVLFLWSWGIPFWASFVLAPASVILAFVSRSKAAVITTNLGLVIFAGLFYSFMFVA